MVSIDYFWSISIELVLLLILYFRVVVLSPQLIFQSIFDIPLSQYHSCNKIFVRIGIPDKCATNFSILGARFAFDIYQQIDLK